MKKNIETYHSKREISRKKQLQKKIGSFSFYLAIPCCWILGICFWFTIISAWPLELPLPITAKSPPAADITRKDIFFCFAPGFLFVVFLLCSAKLIRFRTFLHELKHAALVLITGNKVTEFTVEKHSGSVSFELDKDKTHYGPFISLAPYFLPLLSFPVFIFCLILGDSYPYLSSFCLGVSLAFDLITGYQELHPHQSDLQRILGGQFSSYLFIMSFHFMWISTCLLWILLGRGGFILALSSLWWLSQLLYSQLP